MGLQWDPNRCFYGSRKKPIHGMFLLDQLDWDYDDYDDCDVMVD